MMVKLSYDYKNFTGHAHNVIIKSVKIISFTVLELAQIKLTPGQGGDRIHPESNNE